MKKFYSLIVLMLSLVLPQNIMAADPDLSEFTLIKALDFTTATYPSDQAITLSGTASGITAYETGNKKQQILYDVVTPENLSGYIYFQGTGSKGWAIRSTKGGLWSYNASRSAAIPNLKKDYVVVFKCTDAASNVMTLTDGDGNPDGNFTYTTSEDGKSIYCTMTDDGHVGFCGNKSKGYIESISIYAPGTVLIQPTAKYTAVNGKSRTVTFTGANLAYNTDGSDNYTATNANTWDATVSETTTYYVVSTNGDEKSEPLVFTIEAGTEISLADIKVSLSAISEGFTKTYALTCDNKDVLLNPTAKFTYDFVGTDGTTQNGVECNGTIEATESGTYTITAAADGYVSTTATIDNTKEYELTKTIDFTALKAEDLSSNWVLLNSETGVPGSSSQWQNKYSDVVTDEYYYNFSSETASATDVIPGLNIEFDETGKTPKLYTGFGFMYPVHVLGTDGTEAASPAITDGKIAINEGTAEQFGVYTYINNYGKNGTKTTILAGDQSFALYRFSDLLTKVEIYSPKASSTPTTENIAALKALADGTETTLAVNGAKVTFVSGTDAYIEDETGALLIEGADLNLTAGKAITGTISGKLTIVKEKLHKFVATEATVTEADAEITATVLTIDEANKPENISKLVKLENVDANLDWQTVEDADYKIIMFMDKYNVLNGENPGKVESIVGVIGYMGTNTNMFYPVSKDSIVAAPVVPAKEVKTIAEMKAVEDGTEVNFVMNDVKVTAIILGMRGYTGFIEDETGAIKIGSDLIGSIFMEHNISEGMTVTGHVTGTYSVVDGVPTFDISDNTGATDELTGTEATIIPTETTIAGVKNAESISKYVILKDVKVTGVAEGYSVAYTAAQGEETIAVEDIVMDPLTYLGILGKYEEEDADGNLTINLPEMFESMTAIVSVDWNGNYVLYPKAVVEKEAQEEIAVVWDFTKWSDETVNNLKADAATVEPDADGKYPTVTPWRSYEKVGGPTTTDPDREGAAFWYGTEIAEAQSLTANGTEIAETAGLLFNKVSAGALAIAVNYPSTSIGTYDGPSYLWIGGKNNSFIIPAVKPGSTIEIKLESHKNSDARGVKLSVDGEAIGEAIPTTAETFRITVPASDAETVDVKVENTNGCHIYTIGINDYTKINTGISSINSDVKAVSGVYTINGVKVRNAGESLDGLAKGLYIIGGKKVVIK